MASHYYQWNDHGIHYKKSGLGDPILLVHGLYPGASSEEFEHNVRTLSRNFRVYAIDLLGFGVSDAPRMRYRADLYPQLLGDFVRDVIGEPAGVIAAGASGAFAATLAAEHPDLVSKLVFISPQNAPSIPAGCGWLRRAALEICRVLLLVPPLSLFFQEVMAGEWEIEEMLRRSFSKKKTISPVLVRRLTESARVPGALRACASLEVGLLSLPFEPVLPRVNSPSLFITGTSVTAETSEVVQNLQKLSPISRLEWIDGAAEWAHHEMPSTTSGLIADFLKNEMVFDAVSGQYLSSSPKRAVA